jgi:tetratricopeptide (TPR) repeat protein
MGIEEAGTRVCGPSGWRVVKKVLSPVVKELERRFPKFLLVPEELDKAEEALAEDELFENLVQEELLVLKEGHAEIMTVLARHDEKLQSYRDLIIRAVKEADEKNQKRHAQVMEEFGNVKTEISLLAHKYKIDDQKAYLSFDEIYKQANGYQADAMTWISSGNADAAFQRLITARELAEEGLAREPKNPKMMNTLGFIEKSEAQVCMLRNNPQEATRRLSLAAEYFGESLKIQKKNSDALNGMANIFYYSRDYDTAIEYGKTVLEADPTHPTALLDLSLALEAKIKAFGPAPKLLRLLVSVYNLLEKLMPLYPQIFSANHLEHVQKSRAYYENMEAAVPTVGFYLQQAAGFYRQGNYGKALHAYDQALALKPELPDAHLYRGGALLYLGRSDEALKAIEQAIALRPDYIEALSARGATLVGMGRHEEGLEQIEQVLALQPDYPEAMYNKACVFCLRKDPQAAFEWLQQAIGADPRYRKVAHKEPNFDFLRKHSEMGPRFRELVGK